MQITYKGQSAAAILKTAEIATMRAGNAEIVVKVPGEDRTVIAQLGERHSLWGGNIKDVLVLTGVDGFRISLSTTSRSRAKLESLHAECERVQLQLNARDY